MVSKEEHQLGQQGDQLHMHGAYTVFQVALSTSSTVSVEETVQDQYIASVQNRSDCMSSVPSILICITKTVTHLRKSRAKGRVAQV